MPIPKKFRKDAKDYQKGSKKNGKYKEYKYVKQKKAEKEKQKEEIQKEIITKDKENRAECFALHLFVFKLLAYEPDIFNFILGFLNNPIQKAYYAIECVKYLRETKFTSKDIYSYIYIQNNPFKRLLWHEPHRVKYVTYVIFNKYEDNTPVYFAEDGHMLEIYEYNDFDTENPKFGVLSPHKICKLYDNDIIIKLAHTMKCYKLRLDELCMNLNRINQFGGMYQGSFDQKYKTTASYINIIFSNVYNHNPNLKILKATDKHGNITEYSYYEILLYGENIKKCDICDMIKFSYGFNGHTGFNIHTTIKDFEFKFIDMRNVFESFKFD